MFDKINVSKILKDHISTLKDYRTNKYKPGDFVLFFGIPFILAVIFTHFNTSLTQNLISLFITSLSIFAALLFNLLLLIYNVVQKSDDKDNFKIKFLREIYSNISFCIFIAILAVIVLILISIFASIFDNKKDNNIPLIFQILSSFITYYLLTLFLLTLFMILKRIHVLLYKEVEKRDDDK